MQQTTTTVGLDLAKNVFQVHGVDAAGKVTLRKQLRRSELLELRCQSTQLLTGAPRFPPAPARNFAA